MKLYFAYGSNLWVKQMRERCMDQEIAGFAVLRDFRWIINERGYANVVPSKDDFVEGILYWISEADERGLDVHEGVAKGSYLKEYHHVNFKGVPTLALVYVDPVTTVGNPKQVYKDKINAGLLDSKLSDAYVTKYIRPFVPAAS